MVSLEKMTVNQIKKAISSTERNIVHFQTQYDELMESGCPGPASMFGDELPGTKNWLMRLKKELAKRG